MVRVSIDRSVDIIVAVVSMAITLMTISMAIVAIVGISHRFGHSSGVS